MSDPLFDGDDEANTPLAPEERDGLIPSYITLRRELNEAEQVNIDKGDRWAFNPRARHDNEQGARENRSLPELRTLAIELDDARSTVGAAREQVVVAGARPSVAQALVAGDRLLEL